MKFLCVSSFVCTFRTEPIPSLARDRATPLPGSKLIYTFTTSAPPPHRGIVYDTIRLIISCLYTRSSIEPRANCHAAFRQQNASEPRAFQNWTLPATTASAPCNFFFPTLSARPTKLVLLDSRSKPWDTHFRTLSSTGTPLQIRGVLCSIVEVPNFSHSMEFSVITAKIVRGLFFVLRLRTAANCRLINRDAILNCCGVFVRFGLISFTTCLH